MKTAIPVISVRTSVAAREIAAYCSPRFRLAEDEIIEQDIRWIEEKIESAISARTNEFAKVVVRLSKDKADMMRYIENNVECQCAYEGSDCSWECPRCEILGRMDP